MLLPISLIFAGILLGILLRRTAIPGIAGRIFTPVVVLLLFAMGCAIGRNRTVMDNLPRLGLDAFILATASARGSDRRCTHRCSKRHLHPHCLR